MSTLLQIMENDTKVPYDKSARGRVVFAAAPVTYKNATGETKQSKTVAIADESVAVKVVSYDQTQFNKLVVGTTVMVRNFIKRDRSIILTRTSRLFPTQNIAVPDCRTQEGEALVNPPAAPVVPLKQALSSPPKTKTSVCGKVVQDENEREVMVKNTPTKVRNIYLQDDSVEKVKVTLWRDTSKDIRSGDHVQVSDLVINTYKNETSLNSTYTTSVTKVEQPSLEVKVSVLGACTQGEVTDLLLDDDSIRVVPSELLLAALPEGYSDCEAFFAERGTSDLKIKSKGGDVLSIDIAPGL